MLLHERLLRSVAVSTAIGIPSIVVANSLFGVRSTWQSAPHLDGGGCGDTAQRLGTHCFPGYASDSPGSPIIGVVLDFAHSLGRLAGHSNVGLVFWLALVAVCVLLPLLWATLPAPAQTRAVEVLVFGVATTPMLAIMDVGSSTALVVPVMLWFGVSMARGHDRDAVIAIAAAALLHPALLLLSFLFILRKDVVRVAQAAALSVVALFASYVTVDHGRTSDFARWLLDGLHPNFHLQFDPFPQSVGAGRSLVSIMELIWTRPLGRESIGTTQVFRASRPPMSGLLHFVNEYQTLVLVALIASLAALCVLMYRRGRRLTRFAIVVAGCTMPAVMPAVSSVSRLALVLVPVAVLLRAPHAHLEFFDTAPFWLERATQFVFVVAATISIVPTALPLSWLIPIDNYGSANLFVAMAGPAWLLLLVLLIVGMSLPRHMAVKSGWRARSAPTRRR